MIKGSRIRRLLSWVCLVAGSLGFATASAASAETFIDPNAIEGWADAYLGRAIAEHRAAGITISVVEDGKVVLAKGYGFADAARGVVVNPITSGFDVGSITKTFVATATFQLLERGQIGSLDDPANKYLARIQLPGPRGARVTIRQLLTHQAGVEDGFFGRYAKPANIPLKGAELRRYLLGITQEPGGPTNYSNAGFSVLGVLIEDVTGERLDSYLKHNIWAPLGMSHTSMIYGSLPSNLVQNYRFSKTGQPVADPIAPPHPWIAPAGLVVTTAADMALFMRAQIDEGQGEGPKILSASSFQSLHQEQHRNAPISIGLAHAFWISQLGTLKLVEHGGGTPVTQSEMLLIPQKHFGLFISMLQGGLARGQSYSPAELAKGGALVRPAQSGLDFREAFVGQFLPQDVRKPSGAPVADLRLVAGDYWSDRRAYSTPEVLAEAFNPRSVVPIRLSPDGHGLTYFGQGPYRDAGGGVFRSPTGRDAWLNPYELNHRLPPEIAFTFGASGKVAYLTGEVADASLRRVGPLGNPHTLLLAGSVLGLVMLSGGLLFVWPGRGGVLKLADFVGVGIALCLASLPAVMFLGYRAGDNLMAQWTRGETARFWAVTAASNLAALLIIFLAAVCAWGWARPDARAAQRLRQIHLSLLALAGLSLLYVLNFFNLIGMHIPH